MSSHRIIMINDDRPRAATAKTGTAMLAAPLSDALARIGYDVTFQPSTALRRRPSAGRGTPDLVHAFDWAGAVAASTAMAGSCPVVVTPDGPQPRPGAVDVVDRVVTPSADRIDELLRLGVPRAKLTKISSGVDVELFQPGAALVGRVSQHRTPAKVLAFASATPPAVLGQLVQALVRVPDAQLVVAGLADGDRLADALHDYDGRLPGHPRLRLVGDVSPAELPELYRSVDVLACLDQAGEVTALQAMSCGVPVLGYAAGGTAEVIVDGVTGMLVRPNDLAGLTRALRILLGDSILRMGMACAAADRARSRFSWSRVAVEIDQVYRSVLGDEATDEATPALTEAPPEGELP